MRVRSAIILLLLLGTAASAEPRPSKRPAKAPELPPVRVELQEPVPPVEPMQTEIVLPPSACRVRLSAELAQAPSIPPRAGPGACGGEDLVRLEAIHLPDRGKVAVTPAAVLRCGMAEALVDWVRSDVPPVAGELGARVTALNNFASYDCRGRNNVAGARLSEHGTANAFDLRGFKLANGKVVDLTDKTVDQGLRERLRSSLCGRFTTVLGPGSDRYHENHIHLDLIQRRGGYRMCQWEAREPQVASVPLPPERPTDPLDASLGRDAPMPVESVPLPIPRPKVAGLSGPASPAREQSRARSERSAQPVTTGKKDGTAPAAGLRKDTADRAAPSRASRSGAKHRRQDRRQAGRPRMPWDGWFRFR
jgi:hypothetical protein